MGVCFIERAAASHERLPDLVVLGEERLDLEPVRRAFPRQQLDLLLVHVVEHGALERAPGEPSRREISGPEGALELDGHPAERRVLVDSAIVLGHGAVTYRTRAKPSQTPKSRITPARSQVPACLRRW